MTHAHDTVDHPLPERAEGQILANEHFVDRLSEGSYQAVPGFDGLEQRTFGIWKGTEGRYGMYSMRVVEGFTGTGEVPWHTHSSDQMEYIVEGWIVAEYEGIGTVRLEKGDAIFEHSGNRHRQLEVSQDFVSLQVLIPAEMSTTFYRWDQAGGCFQHATVPHPELTPGKDTAE